MRTALPASFVLVWLVGCGGEGGLSAGLDPSEDVRDPRLHTDVFHQVAYPNVDVLFVVDNSCSMAAHQENLAANFDQFAAFLQASDLDYHVGAVSTDMEDPRHRGRLQPATSDQRWIDPATPDFVEAFHGMVLLGTGGSQAERGLDAAYRCLENLSDGVNAGFRRPDAPMHTIVVSDEATQSEDRSIDEFVAWYDTLGPAREARTFSSIYAGDGYEYRAVTLEIGGLARAMGQDAWGAALSELGELASGLPREFHLSYDPVPDTIEVLVEEPGPGNGLRVRRIRAYPQPDDEGSWQLNLVRHSIIFVDFVPPAGARIAITYLRDDTT